MRILTLNIFVGIFLAGCTAPTINADIDRRFNPPPILDTRPCSEGYRVVLNEVSAHYRILQSPDKGFSGGGKISFPLGETLAAYLRQAQKARAGKNIPLHFYTSDFGFSYAGGSLSKPFSPPIIGEVRYRAHFSGSEPIGDITIQEESSAILPRLWQDVAVAQEGQ